MTNQIASVKPAPLGNPKKQESPTTEKAITGRIDGGEAGKGKSAFSQILDKQREEQMDIFLKMFLTQVQHQDPMNPMDTNEMSRSLMSFHSVAQQSRMNENLGKIIANQERQEMIAAKSYLNKEVSYHGNEFTFDGKSSEISMNLPANVVAAKMVILDSAKMPLTEFDLTHEMVTKPILWEGKNAKDSDLTYPAGQYHAQVVAIDAEGNNVAVPLTFKGIVNQIGYNIEDDEYALLVGGTPISVSDVDSIRKLPSSELTAISKGYEEQAKRYDDVVKLINERLPEKVKEKVSDVTELEIAPEALELSKAS